MLQPVPLPAPQPVPQPIPQPMPLPVPSPLVPLPVPLPMSPPVPVPLHVPLPVPPPVPPPVPSPLLPPVPLPVLPPVSLPVQPPVLSQPFLHPVPHPVPQLVQMPVPQLVPMPVPQPVLQPVLQPVIQPVIQPVPQPVSQPVPQPRLQPVLAVRPGTLTRTEFNLKQVFRTVQTNRCLLGEKTSLFNKIFGRGKSRRSVAVEENLEEEPEVEYATFSAQFPPPEWAWYETQATPMAASGKRAVISSMAAMSPTGVMAQMGRAHTWHHMQGVPHFDAGTQSEFDDEDYMKPCPQPIHLTSTPHVTHNGLPQHGSSSHSHESHSSSYDVTPSPRCPRRPERERSRHHRPSCKPRHHSSRHTPPTPVETAPVTANQNEYVQYGDDDRHIYCEPSNPADMYTGNSQYEDATLSQGVHDRLAPPTTDDLHVPSKIVNSQPLNNNSSKRTELFPHSNSKSLPTRHKSGQRRYRDLNCPGFCGNDISVEYKGRMPKRNSAFSLSRDSGVNCVGVKDTSSGSNNLQGGKDSKKLAILNNQTGVSSSSRVPTASSSSGGLNINNHNRVGGVDHLPTQAQVHNHHLHHHTGNTTAEYNIISHSHQDSGFSSPRTDADHATYSIVDNQHPSLPLNNISIDANNRRSAVHINGERPTSRSLSRDGGRHGKDLNRVPTLGLHGKPAGTPNHNGETGKENRARHPAFRSLESLHITSSEKYPSYSQLHVDDGRDTATVSSSRSGSSKTTVVGVGDKGLSGDANDADTSRISDATYMEIQLVTSDCPVHGDIMPTRDSTPTTVTTRERPQGHRAKDGEAGVSKRHSMVGKSARHHSGQWSQSRHSGSHGHHYGNINLTGNNNNDKEGKPSNPANNSRLAFLGNCEVVGIV